MDAPSSVGVGVPPQPIRLTFVCLGNICRSPMASAVMRHQLAEARMHHLVHVDSHGTGNWHIGDRADPRASAALRRRGYPAGHTARQITTRDLDRYALVVGLDAANVRDLRRLAVSPEQTDRIVLLRDFDPGSSAGSEVPDPYYGGDEAFDHALDLIEPACAGLLSHLQATALGGPHL